VQWEGGNYDHWVGYYSSTPVLKQMIRSLFQRLRTLKIQFVASVIINANATMIQHDIKKIQQEASIMMHHDAITSTSPSRTLLDYMTRIRSTETKIDKLENNLLNTFIESKGGSNSHSQNGILDGSKLVTIFNPMGYERTEMLNFTTTSKYTQVYDSDGFPVQAEIFTEYLAQYTFRKNKNDNLKVYTVVFEAKTPPFSMSKYFYKTVSSPSMCDNNCATRIDAEIIEEKDVDQILENESVKIVVRPSEMISSFKDKTNNLEVDIPTQMYTYPGTSGQTLSGLYIFNPKHRASYRQLHIENRYLQKGKLQTVLHTFYRVGGTSLSMCQSITINSSKNDLLKRTVRVTTKTGTLEYFEFVMRTDISSKFDDNHTEIFVDNGAQSEKKQFYSLSEATRFNISDNDEVKYNGLNGYASIAGTAFMAKGSPHTVSSTS